MIGFEAPRVEADRNVVGKGVSAGEVEVDQSRKLVTEKKYVVGEQIGMNHAAWQIMWPTILQMIEFGRDGTAKIPLDAVGELLSRLKERAPACDRERIYAHHLEIGTGEMEAGERFSDRRTMRGGGSAHPHPIQK